MNYQLPDYREIDIPRTDADLITNNGIDKCRNQDYEEGIADFNAALRLNPNHAHATYNKGRAMVEWGYKQVLVGHDFINAGMNEFAKTSDMQADALQELARSLHDEFRSLDYLA